MVRVDLPEAQARLLELIRAVEEHDEIVVLCRDGVEVAEMRRRPPRRPQRDLTPDPRLKATAAPGFDPAEPLTEDEWPEDAR